MGEYLPVGDDLSLDMDFNPIAALHAQEPDNPSDQHEEWIATNSTQIRESSAFRDLFRMFIPMGTTAHPCGPSKMRWSLARMGLYLSQLIKPSFTSGG